MTGLMPIGVFARATRLSVRALRNYDRLGLLVPAQVDPDTGYRRYGVDQFPRAGLVRRLRELEVPLPEIAEILAAGGPAEARAVIERHRERVAARAARLDEIGARLGAILAEPERVPGWLHVYERWRAPQPTARIVVHTPLSELASILGTAFERLYTSLAELGTTPAGPPGTRYLGDDPDAPEMEIEVYVPVSRPLPPRRAPGADRSWGAGGISGRLAATPNDGRESVAGAAIEGGELPGCLLAATVHEGGYDEVENAYRSLGRWIAEHDRVLAGPAEELYLVSPGPGVPTAALRTEVAWPVRSPAEEEQDGR